MLLARTCPGCRRPSRGVCGPCDHRLAEVAVEADVLLAMAHRVGVDRLVALWAYGPQSRAVVLALKNRSRADMAARLAPELAARVTGRSDVVTWVPASGRGRRRRGYDQGEMLARPLAAELGLPARRLLARSDAGGGRVRSRSQRLSGPRLSSRLVGPTGGRSSVGGRRVLLIDDVVTTGGSLLAAAATLRGAGAETVDAAVLAVVCDPPQLRPGDGAPWR